MKERVLIVTALLFVFCSALVLIDHKTIDAEENQLVRILGGIGTEAADPKKPLQLEPPTLTISKGAVVVWLNFAKNTDCVQVVFEDGKKCADVTDAPTGFEMSSNCYVTSWMPFGGTSSLRFKDSGTYSYTVEMKKDGGVVKETGQIYVKAD